MVRSVNHASVHAQAHIVPASREHLPAIAALAATIWRAHYPGIISHAQIDYMLEQMYSLRQMEQDVAAGIRYDRLITAGTLAGFAAHGPADEPRVGKLHKLYVDPIRHGRGFGRLLLKSAEARGLADGWHTLILQVNKNNEKAIGFYLRSGFTVRESAVFDVGGGFVMDDFIMAKPLAATAMKPSDPARP
jgi:GNAT superfamily N-acetyltransferase